MHEGEWSQFGKTGIIYAGIFQVYYLRVGIFFGCVGIFTYLFRGEVLEKSLHFYFLTPVRREVLVVGKYLSGWLTAATLFAGSVVLSFILMYVPYGAMGQNYFSKGPGVSQLLAYSSVAILACLGYGSVFLLMGLAFRNPVIPAIAVLGWESINFLLPLFLKKISVIYYLNSLCPVSLPSGPFALLADPSPAWVAVLGLVGLTLAVVWIAGLSIRRMEISYGAD
jgi:ABC-type transport system involved in multi-copper enzyme maturation permease subunit